MKLGFWIPDPENGRVNVQSEVHKAIWRVLQAQKINVPYPQHEVRLVDLRNPSSDEKKAVP